MASDEIPVVPGSTGFSYLNEGAANIVYRISVRYPTPEPSLVEEYGEGTPPPSEIDIDIGLNNDKAEKLQVFDNKLLRLRKNLPTTLPVAVTQEAWQRVIAPLFASHQIVEQSLVRLRPAEVIEKLNGELQNWERGSEGDGHPYKSTTYEQEFRPTKRRGIYLADDEFGLLITDMTPGHIGEGVIEFKPKWLAQSPSAPEKAVRCRQCARVARINAELARNGEPLQKSFCPLDLTSRNESIRVSEILLSPEPVQEKVVRFARWIENNTLLQRLRNVQMMLDPIGVLGNDKNNENFRAAMTLRDCTVFVRFPANGEDDHLIEARIGDLDLKSPDKAEYWKDTEKALIDGGWYTGTESYQDQQPMTCQLSPDRDGDPVARHFPLIRPH